MGDLNFIKPEKPQDLLARQAKTAKEAKEKKQPIAPKQAETQKPKAPLFGVNLMSQEAMREVARGHQKKNFMILSGGVIAGLVLFALAFVGVRVYAYVIAKDARQLSVNLGKIDEEITALEKNSAVLNQFQNRLTVLKSLLDGHIYWSQFIAELEKYTLPSVAYDALSVAPGTAISFSATAPDFRTLARQLLVLQEAKSLVDAVRITAGSAQLDQSGDIDGVSFEVSFTMNPNILKKAIDPPK